MQLFPSFERFSSLAAESNLVPVWREFLFDVDTAVTAYAKLAEAPFGFLLESVVGGEQWARYSFLGTRPSGAWRLQGGVVSEWTPEGGWQKVHAEDPLADLDARLRAWTPAEVEGLPRFWGGAVGFFSYDIVRHIEELPDAPPDDLGIPDGLFVFTDIVLAIDNLKGRAMAIAAVPVASHGGGDGGADGVGPAPDTLRALYDDAARRTGDLVQRLAERSSPPPLALTAEPDTDPPFTSSMSREDFEAGVDRIKEYILAGDAFQVVLSQRLALTLEADAFALYRALRSINPSPYLYYLDLDGVALIGSSPEVLVRVEEDVVTVRPIAGTRPRGTTAEEERALADDLLADQKELAEHRMLVDLGRNDVGRVAEYGSVTVPDLMVVERYSHVMHIVSQVEGRLRDGLGAVDVFRACFPAGTVSGAPKVRAMEIIDELESVRRGPYAGAVGHFNYGGRTMDTAITIRTVVATDGKAYVQAGAGIVADSDPSAEYEETLNKARALLRAAAMVEGTAG
ncbi:MAG: anthranilate synthase component I [Gemmatimonadetes bacterium]|nr:anthranilate synthase component I [Gemmatimonadota bacterium]NNF13935.1 anthranilate synthase component I [Gemmatimonadota bacterium]NNL30634.1 anthranilate synthase component I [Gemmatimonadota bacterium]